MLKLYSSKHIIKVLESKGFSFISQKGSHTKYHKAGKNPLTVIVPHPKKEILLALFAPFYVNQDSSKLILKTKNKSNIG